jgi:hypothetical protein
VQLKRNITDRHFSNFRFGFKVDLSREDFRIAKISIINVQLSMIAGKKRKAKVGKP